MIYEGNFYYENCAKQLIDLKKFNHLLFWILSEFSKKDLQNNAMKLNVKKNFIFLTRE